jgi:uncharacterized protein YecE (DUF72 family)
MNPQIGTCSWKYDSWLGLVYTKPCRTAAEYLQEYSTKYRTVEIDSWFYRLPTRDIALDYLHYVDKDFRFTCKIPNAISLTHQRKKGPANELISNPTFLSNELFQEFLDAVEPMAGRIDAFMLQFEYLNKQKMKSLDDFLRALDTFLLEAPDNIPLAIETRNKKYLKKEYFQFLQEKNLIHVFSEKLYMPHICNVYEEFGDLLIETTVMRLLGGDRKEIENKTNKKWNSIVEPRDELKRIAEMAKHLIDRGVNTIINVNNHYEGSAPLTIERLLQFLSNDSH